MNARALEGGGDRFNLLPDLVVRLLVLAGNISPLDVISHLPVLCEDAGVPYCYVPSKEELGAAGQTKRPTSCMLLLPGPAKGKGEDADGKYKEAYDEARKKVKAIAPTF